MHLHPVCSMNIMSNMTTGNFDKFEDYKQLYGIHVLLYFKYSTGSPMVEIATYILPAPSSSQIFKQSVDMTKSCR